MAADEDDKIPHCVWGERVIGKYSHRVYKIRDFSYRYDNVWLVEQVTGNLKVVTLDQLFDNFEHYVPWYEKMVGKNGGQKD